MFILILVALLPKDTYRDLQIGGRSLGLGYAVTSQSANPDNIFFNPAGLSVIEEGILATHYGGEGFDHPGKIKAISLILPDFSFTYFPIASSKRLIHSILMNGESWIDEQYNVDEYVVTITSRTGNATFSRQEPFLLGVNLKYLRGHYYKIEWSYVDSLWSKPEYLITDGDGYGIDAGIMVKVLYLNGGFFLKDLYSRMKWHEASTGQTDKIKLMPRFGISINKPKASVLFDVQKGEEITYHLGGEVKGHVANVSLMPRVGAILEEGKKVRYTLGGGVSIKKFFIDFGLEFESKANAVTIGAQL